MLKRQRFEDSRSDETELKSSKHQELYARDNEKEENLDKFKGKGEEEDIGYVLSFFIILS